MLTTGKTIQVRNDDYCMAPLKRGVMHYGANVGGATLIKDTYYFICNLYKGMQIIDLKVTTVTDLAAASLKFAAFNRINSESVGIKAMDAFFADKSIATAVSASSLTFGATFTKYKPNMYTLKDCVDNEPTVTIKDFNLLVLMFCITGADVPAALEVHLELTASYRA